MMIVVKCVNSLDLKVVLFVEDFHRQTKAMVLLLYDMMVGVANSKENNNFVVIKKTMIYNQFLIINHGI